MSFGWGVRKWFQPRIRFDSGQAKEQLDCAKRRPRAAVRHVLPVTGPECSSGADGRAIATAGAQERAMSGRDMTTPGHSNSPQEAQRTTSFRTMPLSHSHSIHIPWTVLALRDTMTARP